MPKPVFVSDATIEVMFGTTDQMGATPTTWATSQVITCQARSVNASVDAVTQDISTICSTTVELLGVRKQGTVEMEVYIDKAVGPIFTSKINWLARVKVTHTTTAGSIIFYQGLITNAREMFAPGDIQMESVTLTLGGYGLTAVTATT